MSHSSLLILLIDISAVSRLSVKKLIMADIIEIENYNVPVSNNSRGITPQINASCSMTYDEFFKDFLLENRPCVFQSDITRKWRCRREWNVNGAPNFKILSDLFGNCKAPVADCDKQYYNAQLKNDMTIGNYLDYWSEYRTKNYPSDMKLLYLKDWHCVKENKELCLYNVPKFFASDWLNEYHIAHPELEDDYMFVYMGPKGTWTPFHADVFASYSWSANIVGKKKWILFPPGEENALRDSHGQLCFDITNEELLKNSTKYPHYNEKTLKKFEIVQNEGEIIFIPSGWHHQVWNVEDTISVNHNWINGCNIWNSWQSLRNELTAVMREVEDCREMEDWKNHCQLMLATSHGMNYPQFYKFLSFIIEQRLKVLMDGEISQNFGKWNIGPQHCYFDLNQAKIVLTNMMDDSREKDIFELVFPTDQVYYLLDCINNIFQSRPK